MQHPVFIIQKIQSNELLFLAPVRPVGHTHADGTGWPVKTAHHNNIHPFSRTDTLLDYFAGFFLRGG
jgi:hypothetical protein